VPLFLLIFSLIGPVGGDGEIISPSKGGLSIVVDG